MSRSRLRRQAILAPLLLGAALGAPTAASAACDPTPSSPSFARFGDTAEYSLAPDGGFERGAAGWQLLGAESDPGNEYFNIVPGRRSIEMDRLGTAISPEFCVDETHPTFRFMLRPGGRGAQLRAAVIYRDRNGGVAVSQFTSSTSYAAQSGWQPSAVSPLAASIPLTKGGGTANVRLVFFSLVGKHWIDNVMIDPYRRG